MECTKIVGLNLRKDDVLARTGGDEFSILLPATSEKDAGVLAERITRNIEKHNEKSGLPPIKMSLGIASKENTSTPIETILRIADDNMYMEKKEKKRLREAGELNNRTEAVSLYIKTRLIQSDFVFMEQIFFRSMF